MSILESAEEVGRSNSSKFLPVLCFFKHLHITQNHHTFFPQKYLTLSHVVFCPFFHPFSSKKSTFFSIIKILLLFCLDGFPTTTKLPKSRSVSRTSSNSSPFHQDYAEIVDEDADYSSPSRDFELDRECVHLSQILGQGQFGDVYGGFYSHPTGQDDIHVAVKTCKLEADESTAEKILEEACKIFNTQWGKKSDFIQKITCSKSLISRNSQFHNLIFSKIHIFKITF